MLKIVVLVIVIMLMLTGCWQPAIFGTRLKFSVSECQWGEAYKLEDPAITYNWPKKTILDVRAKVQVNCAEAILGGDYEIRDNEIIFKYQKTKCQICTTCSCPHTLDYRLKNLPQKDYQFSVESVVVKPGFLSIMRLRLHAWWRDFSSQVERKIVKMLMKTL